MSSAQEKPKNREQELDEFLELFAIRPYDRARENLIALIDSATREAKAEGYKQGYIDAGIKEITECASKNLFQELLLYKAAYGELPLEQSGD